MFQYLDYCFFIIGLQIKLVNEEFSFWTLFEFIPRLHSRVMVLSFI